MASTSSPCQSAAQIQVDLSDNFMKAEIYNTYVLPILQSLQITIYVMGIVSNLVNIFVFLKTGTQDPVSLSFLMLAFCDFLHILIASIRTALSFMPDIYLSEKRHISIETFENGITWYAVLFLQLSVIMNCYIGVTRACCVALPLKFKTMFTLHKTRVSLTIIFMVGFLLHCPMIVTQRLMWILDKNTNISSLIVQQNRGWPWTLHNIVNRSILSNLCFIIAIISLIILTIKLREAMKFRQATSRGGTAGGEGSAEKEGSKTNSKDLQVIKAVTLVTFMYVTCNLPHVLNSFLRLSISRYNRSGYRYLYSTVLQSTLTLTYVNSSINLIIYYKYNTIYRQFVKTKLGMTT